ncbi:MAG: hypothetical protein J1E83_12610 [Lachnospiraceae bacterium]|nr:hypothetical protein [Lachnospiraceae bacterium]
MKKKDNTAWYIKILRLLKLELVTPGGRVNLAGLFILLLFCLLYTAKNTVNYFISSLSDVVKSIALKSDIYHPYESDSVFKVIVPVSILFVICLGYVYVDEKLKSHIKEKKVKEQKDIKPPHEDI